MTNNVPMIWYGDMRYGGRILRPVEPETEYLGDQIII